MKPDYYVQITYPVANPEQFTLATNIKEERLPELIFEHAQDHISKIKEDKPAILRDTYILRLDIELYTDDIQLSSNCGSRGLALGILLDVGRRLEEKYPPKEKLWQGSKNPSNSAESPAGNSSSSAPPSP